MRQCAGRAVLRWVVLAASSILVMGGAWAVSGLISPLISPPAAQATVALSEETGKDCADCHVTPGGPLTEEGERYLEDGEGDGDGPAAGDSGDGTGAEESAGTDSLLSLPGWLSVLAQWMHLVAVVAWLGAVIFVHVVQSPTIAGHGIPSKYKTLAWPSIVLVGASGLLLTLDRIDAVSLLTGTRWGAILLGKVGVYLLLVAAAVVATFVLSPRLERMAEIGSRRSGPGGDEECDDGPTAALHTGYREQGLVTVGYQGKIYDVTQSQLWSGGRHARRHEAWKDLTDGLAGAPHNDEVFETFSELEATPVEARPASFRIFLGLTYWNLGMILAVLFLVALW